MVEIVSKPFAQTSRRPSSATRILAVGPSRRNGPLSAGRWYIGAVHDSPLTPSGPADVFAPCRVRLPTVRGHIQAVVQLGRAKSWHTIRPRLSAIRRLGRREWPFVARVASAAGRQ